MAQATNRTSDVRRIFVRRSRPTARRAARSLFLIPACLLITIMLSAPSLNEAQEKKKAGRVSDSILGVRVGATREEVHRKLKSLGKPAEDGAQAEEEEETGESLKGGRREVWTLRKTEFGYIVYRLNAEGRVAWISGFVRPGQEIAFAKLGDLTRASTNTENEAIWTVEKPGGGYRLVAKGPQGKARIIYLFSLIGQPTQ